MNKRQLLTLALGILALSFIILSAPKYIYVPHKGDLLLSANPTYAKRYQPRTDWDWIWQRSLPVILISGFLIFVFKKSESPAVFGSVEKIVAKRFQIVFPKNNREWILIFLVGLAPVLLLVYFLLVFTEQNSLSTAPPLPAGFVLDSK